MMEESISENKSRLFLKAIENTPEALFWIDSKGKIQYANDAACSRFGYNPDELTELSLFDLDDCCDPSDWPRTRNLLQNGGRKLYETYFLSKHRDRIPVEVVTAKVELVNRNFLCLFVRDISNCKTAQTESRENETRLRAIAKALPDLVFLIDQDGRHAEVLSSHENQLYLSWNEADIQGRLLHDIFEISMADRFLSLVRQTIRTRRPGRIEFELSVQGENRYFEARTAPLSERIGGKECIVWIVRDITEGKRIEDLKRQNSYLQEELQNKLRDSEIVGRSEAMQSVFKYIGMVAHTDTTVLLQGETGTGKELVARAIHQTSSRRAYPLIKVNCGALPANLVESELFGHEKGAFTSAGEQKKGRFELAHRGTLFLDETGDLPPEAQSKLLRVLQENEFERVGGTRTIKVDVRVIAATNRDLLTLVKEGSFRADLFYRLNIFPIKIPPLRERKEDINMLAHHFVKKSAARMGKRIDSISPAAFEKLKKYNWPGNVRELANVLERAVIVCNGQTIQKSNISVLNEIPTASNPAFLSLEEMERRHIQAVLEKTGGIISGPRGAAAILKVNRSTLWSRMQKLGIRIKKQVA